MNKKPLGSPVKSDLKRNCLLCSRWAMCRDPNKDMDYACTRFTTEFDASIYDVIEEDNEYEKKTTRKLKKLSKANSEKADRLGFNSKVNITDKHIKEDSIYDLITDVLDSGNPLPPDLKINDRDIPKPANIIEWMTEEEFIGGDQQPFARQMQIALHFMAEWCPKCSDEDYIENIPVEDTLDDVKSNVVFLKNGKCPKCKATKYDLVTEGELTDPVELISILGQRSGKSILSTMLESYSISKWVTTPNLPSTFKVLQSSVFTGTYTATTFGQAKGSFWDPLNAILLDSNWFKQYHKFLTETGYKLGEELYKHSETILTYRHKNMILAPASPSQRSLRGRTRLSCFPKGTKVKTENGVMDISNPNIIGKRAEFLGKTGIVTKHFDNGARDLVIAKTSLGTKIKTTLDHKFVVFDTQTERFVKKKISNVKNTDKLVISLGHKFPDYSPKLPELDDSKYIGKSTDTVYENTLKKMFNLQKFDFRDFPEISQNLFYVYTSSLRRKGVLKVTPRPKRIKGEPNTYMQLINIESYDELREKLIELKRNKQNSTFRKWSDELRKTKLPTHMSVELAWILGALISDGKYCYETEFEFANTDYAKIEKFARCFKTCFGVDARVNGPYQPKEEHKLPYWCVRFGTKYLKDFFRKLGLKKNKWAGNKRIPDIMWMATKEECLSFIGGLWDGDGCGIRSYCSISKHLLNDLQQMLFMLNIVSKIVQPKLYKDGDYKFSSKLGYIVLRSMYDKVKFAELLSPYSIKISSKANSIISLRKLKRGYHTKNTYSYPVQTIKDTRLKGGSSRERIWLDSKLNKTWSVYKNEYALNCLRLNDEYHAEYLSKWINKNIALCDLISIKKCRPQKVYDITVDDKNHVYTIAGGYLVSNCVVDEAGWFRVGQKKQGGDFERMNGNEVYAALKRSLTTMRVAYQRRFEQGYYNLPKPTLSMISSPSARNDLIMTRFRKSQGSTEVYTCKTPTWLANPNLPRKAFNEEFRTDYVAAMRDYGCEPPMAANPWIKDEELIENSFGSKKNAIITTTKRIKTKSRKLATSAHYKTLSRPIPPLGGGTILGLDAGFSNNSFAFCIAVPNSIPNTEDDEEENVLVGMDVLAVGEIIPRKDYPISFTSVYKNILEPLCTEFNVAVVISDSWQNKKIQQDLEENVGVSYYEIKAGMQEFIDYKDCLYHELITHPKLDMKFKEISEMTLEDYPQCFAKTPVAHLAFQMLTVQNTGTAVVKGEEGTTDDILRACIVCHAGLQDEDVLDDVLSFSTVASVPKLALGAVALGSTGGAKPVGASSIGVVSSYGSGGSVANLGNIGVLGRKR